MHLVGHDRHGHARRVTERDDSISFNPAGSVDPRSLFGTFRSDLWFPRYREGASGPWQTRIIAMPALRGYWGETYAVAGTVVLSGPVADGEASWMSIVPMEIESQEIGIAAAHGHTVVLGLGMGWCAANVALNPAVTHVTVVERDPHVIELIAALGIFEQLPREARGKIRIVQADALDWRPDMRVDSLQADIWAKFVEPQKWDDVRRMQRNIGAGAIYFWGQEMELWRLACRKHGRIPDMLPDTELADLVAATGLPLISTGYGDCIADAARWWTPKTPGWWEA